MSITRRDFLKKSSLAAAALAVPSFAHATELQGKKKAIGVQIYTLRDDLGKDLLGTLKQVAAIGYQEVELFGYGNGKIFGKTAKEFRSILDDLGLKAVSGHYLVGAAMPQMEGTVSKGWEKAIEDAATLGQQYMICAYLFPDERKTLDQYKQYAGLFNKAGELCQKSGLQFGYHNHDFEFETLENTVPYDLLLKETDASLVKMELDLYWATRANQDPVALFKKNPGRFPLWHVKDMENSPEKAFAEVGTGVIDFKRIFKAAKTAGMKHFFVEQDVCKRPPLTSITISFKNVKKLVK